MVVTTAEGTCLFCGSSQQIHVETGRCQRCGRVVRGPGDSAPSTNGHATPAASPATPSKSEPFRLPATTRTRNWIHEARTLRDNFLTGAQKAEAKAKAASDEAARLRRAASVFAQLLDQIDVEPASASGRAAPEERGRRHASGTWSAYAEACLGCGKSDVSHCAKGYCKQCYDRQAAARRKAR